MKKRIYYFFLLFLLVFTIGCQQDCKLTSQEPNDSQEFYHDRWYSPSIGYEIGQIGAIEYLLDKNGNRIGGGYHSYEKRNGVIYGKLGAVEEIVIDKNGEINHLGGANKMLEDKYEWEDLP